MVAEPFSGMAVQTMYRTEKNVEAIYIGKSSVCLECNEGRSKREEVRGERYEV